MNFKSGSTKALRRIGSILAGSTLAAGLLAGPMGGVAHASAQAGEHCAQDRSYHDVDFTNINAGTVDYGHLMHWNGTHEGRAETCWSSDRSYVSHRGKLSWDSWNYGCAGVEITLYSRTGARLDTYTRDVCGKTDSMQPDFVYISFEHEIYNRTAEVNKLRIRLYKAKVGNFSDKTLVATAWDAYGD